MALFDITDEKLHFIYDRIWTQGNMKPVNPGEHPELQEALMLYASKNNCSYDDALYVAMHGKRFS